MKLFWPKATDNKTGPTQTTLISSVERPVNALFEEQIIEYSGNEACGCTPSVKGKKRNESGLYPMMKHGSLWPSEGERCCNFFISARMRLIGVWQLLLFRSREQG